MFGGLWAAAATAKLFATLCAPCHGVVGLGDGVGAAYFEPGPPNLQQRVAGGLTRATILSRLRTASPSMPSFASRPVSEREALANYVLNLEAQSPLAEAQQEADWWQRPVPDWREGRYTADAAACGVCHPKEFERWQTSAHARATGPGLMGQRSRLSAATRRRCDACHAPLATQAGARLHRQGVSCPGCHVRQGRKAGPPHPILDREGAPEDRARPLARFERSDFCIECHNLPLAAAVDGSALLDTWREWATSPWLVRGIQCQSCHQAGADHGFEGVHSAEMVAKAVELRTEWSERDGVIHLEVALRNTGAGHHFPTTATPRAVLRVVQDDGTAPLQETAATWAIGRTVARVAGAWTTRSDTRIPVGHTARRRYEWRRASGARGLRVELWMFPDWMYIGIYERLLAGEHTRGALELKEALREARSSGFLVESRRLVLP